MAHRPDAAVPPGRRRTPFFLLRAALAALLTFTAGAPLQAQLIERIGSAEAPVYEDNLDAAKSRALRGAQRDTVQRMLGEMVAPEWVELFGGEIRKRILRRPTRYISSYRVRRLEVSFDRTRYFATLAAQVNRKLLVRDLRALALPVKGDAARPLLIAYPAADPLLGRADFRRQTLSGLRARLELLNFQVTRTVPLRPADAEMLGNPFGDAAVRGEWLSRRKVEAALFVAFDLGEQEEAAGSGNVRPDVAAYLYQAGNGNVLGSFSVRSTVPATPDDLQSAAFQKKMLARLVAPLVVQLQPGGIKAFGAVAGSAAPLRIRVLGLASVEEEELFARALFNRESRFAKFVLTRLDRDSVTYTGSYGGDRRRLEVELPGKKMGDFRVDNVFWFNGVLELKVRRVVLARFTEMKLFPEELRPAPVTAAIETYLRENPEFPLEPPSYTEAEDNGWLTRANTLPFNTTLYGFIDSRRDTDFYVAEELKEGEVVVIAWHRVGRTNLTPAVRLYDERGLPVRFYHPNFRIRTKYVVPKGQHAFFVEVTDRFGGMRWDTGGYLSFNYLLQVERAATD